MAYTINQRDVEFTLFEQIKIQELSKCDAYQSYTIDDYKAILDGALKFAQSEVEPLNKIGDQQGCKFENGKVTTPPGFKEAYKNAAEMGFIGLDTPTTYGGQALPNSLSTAIQEYMSGACVPFAMYLGLTRGSCHLIETFGTEKLAQLFCSKMYSGIWGGTMCLTEPNAGSAVGDLKTTGIPQENGTYQIKGNKIFISSGDHDITENIIHLVLARVEGDPEGSKGISLFVVPKIWVNEDGSLAQSNDVTTINIEHKMGIKASSTCSLGFGDNGKCFGFLVGERCKGMSYMFQMMNEARIACGMQGLSLSSIAYEHALDYSKQRTQGGKTAIIDYPDVKRMLITQKAYVEGMRALLYQTAYFCDLAKHDKDPAQREYYEGQIAILTPICKAYCSDMGFRVTELAIQCYGGYGYISEYPVEQFMRDCKISSIYEGTNGIQALDLIGRKLGLKSGQYFKEFYERLSSFCKTNTDHPKLGDACKSLQKSLDTLGQIAMQFAGWAMSGDREYPMLNACSFLSMCGDAIVGQLLLEQAVLADVKLLELCQQNKIEPAKLKEFAEKNESAQFYDGKVKTALFYIHHLLPTLTAKAKAVLSQDRSALEIVL